MTYPDTASTDAVHNLTQVMARHRAFWTMAAVDRPLVSVERYQPLERRQPFLLADGSLTQDGTRLLPDLLDVQRLVEQLDVPSALVSDDLIQGIAPYDLCWNEALVGCPIYWRAGFVWSETPPAGWNDVAQFQLPIDKRWLDQLLAMTELLVAQAHGRYPICQPLLRGPIDIAAALLGDMQLCWLLADEPARAHHLLERCTDLFIMVAQAWGAATPPFQGGSCEYKLWAPGRVVRMQADNAALLSPRWYQEFLLPCDARICAAFDYPLIHTHSGVLPIMVDALLALEPLRAIQVSLDYPAGPPLAVLLPHLKQVNACKPLIITGAVTQQELAMLLQTLSSNGLCLQVALRDGG